MWRLASSQCWNQIFYECKNVPSKQKLSNYPDLITRLTRMVFWMVFFQLELISYVYSKNWHTWYLWHLWCPKFSVEKKIQMKKFFWSIKHNSFTFSFSIPNEESVFYFRHLNHFFTSQISFEQTDVTGKDRIWIPKRTPSWEETLEENLMPKVVFKMISVICSR